MFSLIEKEFLIRKLLQKTSKNNPTGCWLYTGKKDISGYVRISFKKLRLPIHRWSLVLFENFDYKSKKSACHKEKCPNKHCWNPSHIYAGDQSDNTMDLVHSGKHHNTNKQYCPKGHEYTKKNTYVNERNQRQCKACRNILMQNWRKRNK